MKYFRSFNILSAGIITFFILCFSSCGLFFGDIKNYEIVSEEYHSCVFLKKISVDTGVYMNKIYGIKLGLSIDTKGNETLEKFGNNCNGYELNLTLKDQNNKEIPAVSVIKDSLQRQNISYTQTLNSLKANVEFFIPYCYLNLKKGLQNLNVSIEAFPVEVKYDSSISSNIQSSKRLKNQSDMDVKIKFQINQPALFLTRIYVESFETNTKNYNASNMDFHLFGPGYPDLFWSLTLNNREIYRSPVLKNELSYDTTCVSEPFYISDKDLLTFSVMDYDMWSRNDILESFDNSPIKLSRNINKPDILQFRVITNLKIAAVIKE